MHCQEAQECLERGVEPGSREAQRVHLGFHLASCPQCRDYRRQRERLINQQLLAGLLAQPLPEPIRVQVQQRQRRPLPALRATSAALLIGGALSLGGVTAASAAPATSPASPAVATSDVLRSPGYATAAAPAGAATGAISNSTIRFNHTGKSYNALAHASLQAGLELQIPAVAHTVAGNSIAAQTVGSTYVVQPGDTLSAIALRAYGNAGLWPTIYNANVGTIGHNPDLIMPGQRLTIPAIQASPTPPVSPPTHYTVVVGDTLSGIAQRMYGNANLWPAIYNANVNVIGHNPGLIFPGQNLAIPMH